MGRKKQNAFFDALRKDDKEAFKKLLIEEDQELEEIDGQIDYLFSIFPKNDFEFYELYMFPASYGFCDSKVIVTSPAGYFEIRMGFSYSYTEAPSRGIKDIWIMNDKYIVNKSDRDTDSPNGIQIYYDEECDKEIRIVNCYILEYIPYDRDISLEEVKEFVNGKDRITYGEFKERFGLPNTTEFYYYELKSTDDKPLWLNVCINNMGNDDDFVYRLSLCSQFDEYLGTEPFYLVNIE